MSLSKLHADFLSWTKNLYNELLQDTATSVCTDRNITECTLHSFMDVSQQYK